MPTEEILTEASARKDISVRMLVDLEVWLNIRLYFVNIGLCVPSLLSTAVLRWLFVRRDSPKGMVIFFNPPSSQIVPPEGDASFTMKAFPASDNFTYDTIPDCITPACTVVNGDTLLITGPRLVNKKSDNVGSAFNLYADFIHPTGT